MAAAFKFKFNFLATEEDDQPHIEEDVSTNDSSAVLAYKLSVDPSRPLYSAIIDAKDDNSAINHVELYSGVSIHHVPFQYVKRLVKEQSVAINDDFARLVAMTEGCSTDLVPGQYEGGFKVWECTYDLLEFLDRGANRLPELSDCKVLDLGCGAGLLGVYALTRNASQVDFHDFNHEVLSYLTIPNVLLNDRHLMNQKHGFYCGDWSDFGSVLEQECGVRQYDVILTSETIYSLESQKKLLELFISVLSPEGVAYVAAKIHYFGVGGSVSLFIQLVEESKVFNCETVNEIKSGLPRIIIKLTWK